MTGAERPEELPILVTGAGGFIGAALGRLLSTQGWTVRAHLGPPGAQVAPAPAGSVGAFADIDDLPAIRSLVEGVGTVVHLAGPASVAASFPDPIGYARVHVVGTATVLEACRASAVRRLVYVSSAEVYGLPDRNPVAEDHPLRPRSPYGVAKLGAEGLVRSLAPVLGIEAVVLRPFSVYGPGAPVRSLVGTLIDQALHRDAILVADLRPERDYCYVDDVAGAIARACSAPRRPSAVFNVGTGLGTSVADMARHALAAAGRDLPVTSGDADRPAGTDTLSLVADVDRIHRGLGWRAETPLREGLARTVESIRAGEVAHP